MKQKIKVIIKRPDEPYGHVATINNTLEKLQEFVGGPIEAVTLNADAVIICHEEGKILGLKPNFYKGSLPYGDLIRGTVVIVGVDGDEFTDCPMTFWTWRQYLRLWGND